MAIESVRFSVESRYENCEINLAQFMNGYVICDKNSTEEINCELYKSKVEIRNKQKRILVASSDHMEYIGYNTGFTALKAPTYAQYYVCIFDKRKRKMRIVNQPPNWYQMKPKCCISDDGKLEKDGQSENTEISFSERVDNLTSAFGSSKSKRAMASRKRNKVTGESLEMTVGAAVNEATTGMDVTDLTPAPQQDSASEIPPCNRAASSPQEVYRLEDIISGAEMEAMRGPASLFVNMTREHLEAWHTARSYPGYILHHLNSLPINPDAREHKAVCLAYLNYLISMHQFKAVDLKRKDPFPIEMPLVVKQSLTSKYILQLTTSTGQQVKCIPARLKDKLASYILVLCLILDEFQLDCDILMKDLKLGLQKLTNYLRALGCRVSTRKATTPDKSSCHIATLPIPLTFPTLQPKKKKERR